MSTETHTEELLVLAETLGDVRDRLGKIETEFSTQAKPLEAATTALTATLAGIKSLQFHIVDNNLGALSTRVEEYRKVIGEQVETIALELKRADDANAAKTGETADALRAEIAQLQKQIGGLNTQFARQIERVELEAKREVEKLAMIPGPKGEPGLSIRGAGSYDSARKYSAGEITSFLGGSYLSNVDDNDEKPSSKSKKWTQIASRGPGGGAGNFASLAGVCESNQGGSGQTTLAASTQTFLDTISTTQGTVLYNNGTDWVALAPGTAGHFLQTQGAAANPVFAAASGEGLGDVVGPASSTDNAIVRFDGAGGKNVQNSAVTIADTTGAMAWAASQNASLTAGSSGASLVLGQGANGAVTITPAGSGALLVGGSATGYTKMVVGGTLPTAANTSDGIDVIGTIPAGSTTAYHGFVSQPTTAASAFTLGSARHFRVVNLSLGAGSSATNQYGYYCDALSGAGTNYAFFSAGAGLVKIGDTTASTSTTTGSLINAGGFGNAGAAYIGGVLNVTGAVTATSTGAHVFGTTNTVTLQAGAITATAGFGCNTKAAQGAYASGGALAAYGAGANGFDSGANASALHALVVAIRAALVANGIMS